MVKEREGRPDSNKGRNNMTMWTSLQLQDILIAERRNRTVAGASDDRSKFC